MSIVTMDMGSYEVENTDSKASEYKASEYEDEVLFAGWIPDLYLQEAPVQSTAIPEDLLTASPDIFLRKLYSFQR
ncbi:MAG: hypothetical protein WBM09_12430 [Gallionella sp.]